MRADAGFIVTHLLFAAAGGGLLYALGLVELTPGRLAVALGPAYVAGVALVVPLLILLLVVGVPFSSPTIVLVALACTAATFLIGRRRRGRTAAPPPTPPRPAAERTALIVTALLGGAWAVWIGDRIARLSIQLDDTRIWNLKALALFYYDHLEPHVFRGPSYAASHLDYPILQPTLVASNYRLMASPAAGTDHLIVWIFVVCLVWTAAWVLARPGRGLAWLAPVAVILIAAATLTNVQLAYADVVCALLLAVGVSMIARWIDGDVPAWLWLGSLLVGAAAVTKNEGVAAALVVLIVTGVMAATSAARRSAVRSWLAAAAVTIAVVLPWQIWVAAHHLKNTDQPPLHRMLSPSYLGDRIDRARIALAAMLQQVDGTWPLFFAAFLAAAIAALFVARMRRVTAFWLAVTILTGFSVMFAYWTSALDIQIHLATSVDRTVAGTVLLAALGLSHLAASATATATQEREDADHARAPD